MVIAVSPNVPYNNEMGIFYSIILKNCHTIRVKMGVFQISPASVPAKQRIYADF